MALPPLTSIFSGADIFGAPQEFTSTKLAGDVSATALFNSLMPASIDAFLGFPIGTTKFGPFDNGVVFACSGIFYDLSVEGIQGQQALMMSFAGSVSLWLRPTGLPWPANAEYWKNASFRAAEVVFSGITPYPGNQYICTYNMIMRTVGNS